MRGIDHPGIVKLISFFESDEHYFLILERKSIATSAMEKYGPDALQ